MLKRSTRTRKRPAAGTEPVPSQTAPRTLAFSAAPSLPATLSSADRYAIWLRADLPEHQVAASSLRAAQTELKHTRSQLRGCEAELVSARERVKLLADENELQQSRVGDLTQQLHDQQQEACAMSSTTESLQHELDHAAGYSVLESEHSELAAVAQREKSAAIRANEKAELGTLQDYVLRACDEFTYDCPQYHHSTAASDYKGARRSSPHLSPRLHRAVVDLLRVHALRDPG